MVGAYKDMKFDKTPYGGFYTQEDIKEVVAYASKKFLIYKFNTRSGKNQQKY